MGLPNLYDMILLLFSESGNKFKGKTNVHKNLFLLKYLLSKKKIGVPYSFRPYHYGPFSYEISDALDFLESSGLLTVSEERFDSYGASGEERTITVFEVSKKGDEVVAKAKKSYPEFCSAFSSCFSRILSTGKHQNTQVLATAAKMKLILGMEKKPMTQHELEKVAAKMGWKLEDEKVRQAGELLQEISLISTAKKR